MIGNAPISKYTNVPGHHSDEEARILIAMAGNVPEDGIIVELGGEYGRSASEFAYGSGGHARIFTIDKFPQNHHCGFPLLYAYQTNLAEAGYETIAITGDTHTYDWNGPPIDLLFIDADHSYDGVKADITRWWPYIRTGGVVVFHDYANEHHGRQHHYLHYEVKRAVDEFVRDNHLSEVFHHGPDSLVWIFKPAEKHESHEIPDAEKNPVEDFYFDSQQAADYLEISLSSFRKRKLSPDRQDGRKYLYKKATLDESK